MARLQILELPEGSGDDRPPFVLVVDQALPARQVMVSGQIRVRSEWDMLAEEIGARGVVVTPETIDIPANDTTAYLQQVAEETGATIGKITSAYTAQTLADERTDITRDMYRLAKWKQKLADALGIDRASNWDDIRNTAAEFRSELIRSENAREHLRQERDTQTKAIERVRNLHRPVEHRGQAICWTCSNYDLLGNTTDTPPVPYDQCGTLKALAAEQPSTDA
ncbi:hypothetical protein ACKI1J_14770 [Streptomyces scabiei]|uniref:hypothetical protein n=1 Tax=Streptomyces scabiei TaxID=1930 RepID=UPI0038F70BBF